MNFGFNGVQVSPVNYKNRMASVPKFTNSVNSSPNSVFDDEFSIDGYLDPKWSLEGVCDITLPTVKDSLCRMATSGICYLWQPFDNPSTWLIEVKLFRSGNPAINNYSSQSISISQDAGTRITFTVQAQNTNTFYSEVTRWTAVNAWAQTLSSINIGLNPPAYLRMGKYSDNAIYCSVSWDGLFFFRMHSHSLNGVITPNRCGVWIYNSSTGIEYFRFRSWIGEYYPSDIAGVIRGIE